ncbi:MAG: Gfo/Idh/MocA family oxidoreductase [Actinobacteria bacterium]|nr:Gfo/Idh/MocA family oxidoreductase [Actinomycetota bacterium]
MARTRIAVIGTGWWSTQHHLPSLCAYDRADLVALVDPNRDRLEAATNRFSPRRFFTDYRQLFSEGGVDGVVIAVPHVFHYEIAKAALDAGVHVLVEKPMVLVARQAWDLVERASSRGLHLVVGYTFQFTTHARRAREILGSGAVGQLQLISVVFSSMVERFYRGHPEDYASVFGFPLTGPSPETYSDPAIAGGGHGHTQLTHAMGMVFWATGSRVSEVFAFMDNFGLAVDLADAIAFRLDGDTVGTIGGTGGLQAGQPQQQGISYYGSDGFVLQDLINGRLAFHRNDGSGESFSDLTEEEIYPAEAPSRSFVDLILEDGENFAPGESAAATVEFLEAAYRSARDDRPVRIDELA